MHCSNEYKKLFIYNVIASLFYVFQLVLLPNQGFTFAINCHPNTAPKLLCCNLTSHNITTTT